MWWQSNKVNKKSSSTGNDFQSIIGRFLENLHVQIEKKSEKNILPYSEKG